MSGMQAARCARGSSRGSQGSHLQPQEPPVLRLHGEEMRGRACRQGRVREPTPATGALSGGAPARRWPQTAAKGPPCSRATAAARNSLQSFPA